MALPSEQDYETLGKVRTAASAARLYNVDLRAVLYLAKRGRIVPTQDGRIWLIYLPSLVRLWGPPTTLKPKCSETRPR